ncbi:hypothetical protein [Micromonospora echinofusca]|uniref:Activator of Hsp90 ATPase homolog 1-like protein n=1 Tax=Micromonospora echinofusca TaxID=47858 RepID=A0ABS3VZL9_MICEH|nr:hypothetical protein [Micromonospora echinofusca]MBO4209991.1 hypothetical protein [Micromonospora echinofusca]
MSTGTGHRWFDLFQGPGTAHWTWQIGEREHHWTFSFRPLAELSESEIVRHFTVWVGNQYIDHFDLRVAGNGSTLHRLSASWVSGA